MFYREEMASFAKETTYLGRICIYERAWPSHVVLRGSMIRVFS